MSIEAVYKVLDLNKTMAIEAVYKVLDYCQDLESLVGDKSEVKTVIGHIREKMLDIRTDVRTSPLPPPYVYVCHVYRMFSDIIIATTSYSSFDLMLKSLSREPDFHFLGNTRFRDDNTLLLSNTQNRAYVAHKLPLDLKLPA